MLDTVSHFATIHQDAPHASRSDKYSHLKTSELIEIMGQADFKPSKIIETRVRKTDKQGFQKHMVRFRHSGVSALVGDSLPEIVAINSHDGSTGFQLWAGIFRLICSNGMVVASHTYGKISIPHRGDIGGKIIDASYRVIDNAQKALTGVQEWTKIRMTESQQIDFAANALALRYGSIEESPVHPVSALIARRNDDLGDDLWRVFNRVQENVTRGGLVGYNRVNEQGERIRRSVRPVRGIDTNIGLNADLWKQAEAFAMAA